MLDPFVEQPVYRFNQLFARIAELERRLIIIERLLKGPDDTTVYPYSANLPSELIGKVEVRYTFSQSQYIALNCLRIKLNLPYREFSQLIEETPRMGEHCRD